MASRCKCQSLSSRMRCSRPCSRGGFHAPSPRYPCARRVDPAPSAAHRRISLTTDHCSRSPAPITRHVLIPGVRAMPEATFNNHRTATRTQRPASTAVRPDAPRPLRSYFSSPSSLRRSVASSLFSSRYAHNVALRKNCTYQTNPFASPTSIPVFRPAPHAFVKHGRMDKEGDRWDRWSNPARRYGL